MAKPVDHDAASSVATVGLETGKGVVGGVLAAGLVGAAVLGGIGLLTGGALFLASVGFLGGAIGGATIGAVGGGTIGAIKGIAKVQDEKAVFAAKSQAISTQPAMLQAQQEAYMAGVQQGVQVGQAQVVQKLQEVQAMQEAQAQQAGFAEKYAKKGAVSPETVAAQREAAGNHHIG